MSFYELYAPTDPELIVVKSDVPAQDKLATIAQSPPLIDIRDDGSYMVRFPYTDGAEFLPPLRNSPNKLATEYFNIGDPDLFSKGIGSRMLRAGVIFGKDRFSKIDTLSMLPWVRLGLVNTAISVFGAENITIKRSGEKLYGRNGNSGGLEDMMTEYPGVNGVGYQVQSVSCRIDDNLQPLPADTTPIVRYRLPAQKPSFNTPGILYEQVNGAGKDYASALYFRGHEIGNFVISHVYVEPERRGHGKAVELVSQMANIAKEVGANRIIAEVESLEGLKIAHRVFGKESTSEYKLHGDTDKTIRAKMSVDL